MMAAPPPIAGMGGAPAVGGGAPVTGGPPAPAAFQQSPLSLQNVGGGGLDIQQMAAQVVNYLNKLDEPTKYQELNRLRMEQPEVHRIVLQLLSQGGNGAGSANLPLPEQKPPRRGPEAAQI